MLATPFSRPSDGAAPRPRDALSDACYDHAMVAGSWRRGSFAVLAMTLLMAHPAAAEPVAGAVDSRQLANARSRGALAPSKQTAERSHLAAEPDMGSASSGAHLVEPILPPLKLTPPPPPEAGLGTVLGRVPTASWAMGCAAGVALVVHALYQNTSERRRQRMRNCADDCPDYRIDHYEETRERADLALRLSVFAAASAVWLAYNDPEEVFERMGQRKLPREKRGFRVKVKPERRGVWASVVAYF
jgi:hypothetical protein